MSLRAITLQGGRLTLLLGLRWDEQRGTGRVGDAGATAEWRSLAPRLGFTLALDESHQTVLRAAYGRFTSRLGPALASRWTTFPFQDLEFFTDADGDLVLDPEESASRVPWIGVRPDLLASGLSPEITDEALLGIERQLGWRFVTGLTLTHRRSHDLLERRTLVRQTVVRETAVREAAGGTIRQATAGDWLPAGSVSGRLPGGEPYDVDYFDLRPGLELVPSGLWVNGDRRRETLAASLTWRGRLGDRWRTRGHLSWSDSRWRLGEEFLRFDDPTDTAGSGDDDGDRTVDLRPRDALGTAERAIDSRWSFHWSAGVELPRDFDLGLALDGREGYPLPYFRRVARERAGIAAVELTDRADSFRAPDVVTLDARLAKELTFGDFNVSFALEAFNLFGAGEVLHRELDLGVGRGGAVGETLTPRVWRFGVRLGWR